MKNLATLQDRDCLSTSIARCDLELAQLAELVVPAGLALRGSDLEGYPVEAKLALLEQPFQVDLS